jgi:hypothetical protein
MLGAWVPRSGLSKSVTPHGSTPRRHRPSTNYHHTAENTPPPRHEGLGHRPHVHGYRSTAMRLADHEARARLESHDHGILCTVHAERGVDAVPVAYAVDDDGYVGVPIDRVKPKASLRLQRERNLEADPRATLLVEHWDRSDWSRLWWVRAELAGRALPAVPGPALRSGTGAAHSRRGRLGRRRPLIPGQWERAIGAGIDGRLQHATRRPDATERAGFAAGL